MEPIHKSHLIDDLLAQMPGELPPPDLALRVCQAVRLHHRRTRQARLVLSAFLALSGLWLALPAFSGWLQAVWMPKSALPLAMDWLAAGLAGVEVLLTTAAAALSQSASIFTSLGTPAIAGMIALAISALLALDLLVPRREF